MQQADMLKLFRTIIYIVGFYYIFRFLAKLFFPILLKKVVEKAQQNFEKQQQTSNATNPNTSKTNNNSKVNPVSTKKVGDYIDFEEIK